MCRLTPLHIDYYKFLNNKFLNWNDWNCLYDFTYANQNNLKGRTHLATSITTMRIMIKSKVGLCEEITWHYSEALAFTKVIKWS